MYYFCIVGTQDNPLYETDLTARPTANSSGALPPSMVSAGVSDAQDKRTSGLFGFGSALGALADGIGGSRMLMGSGGEKNEGNTGSAERQMLQMIAHGSLDIIEDRQFVSNTMYLKSIDRINDWSVSAFVVPGNVKFIMLHEHKHEDGIRNFFLEVWELWTKPLIVVFAPVRGDICNDMTLTGMFKERASVSAIEEAISAVEKQGGLVKQRYNADFMRGFAAYIPDDLAEKFSSDAQQNSSNM
ncbi:TRAPP subunit [Malassezia cuniculi]|uniref:TRAPP subunit n=1 Tax=Malassezia cuniculi TaxID=948313 RepID=A0AAF0J724_9BASI|nr:TRAPP subunit [Malassezia cuniculi]